MSIRKVTLFSGASKWEVCLWSAGRNSKRIRRRFDRKSDAESYLNAAQVQKSENAPHAKPSVSDSSDHSVENEARYWLKAW